MKSSYLSLIIALTSTTLAERTCKLWRKKFVVPTTGGNLPDLGSIGLPNPLGEGENATAPDNSSFLQPLQPSPDLVPAYRLPEEKTGNETATSAKPAEVPAQVNDTLTEPAQVNDTLTEPAQVNDTLTEPAQVNDTLTEPAQANDTLTEPAPQESANDKKDAVTIPMPDNAPSQNLTNGIKAVTDLNDTAPETPPTPAVKPVVTPENGKVQLSSSIILFYFNTFEDPDRCKALVKRAAERSGAKSLMFVPTAYWKQGDNVISHYCYNKAKCTPATPEEIARFESIMTDCLQVAVQYGMNLAFTPHLDDSAEGSDLSQQYKAIWRNWLVFDPEEKYQGASYIDMMLLPLLRASKAVATPQTAIDFGVVGEMSATVFYNAAEWIKVIGKFRQDYGSSLNIRFGVAMNFNKISLDSLTPDDPVYEPIMKTNPQKNLENIKKLFLETIDFFGISAYASVNVQFEPSELEYAADIFNGEFQKYYQLSIEQVIGAGKRFIFAECGLGGGYDLGGVQPAPNAQWAASSPYFSVKIVNSQNNPWANSEVKEFRDYYTKQLLKYLAKEDSKSKYDTRDAYLWNMGSYDFQGISSDAVYDEALTTFVRNYNQGA
ncbi:hypothetical protein MP638_004318 [Amoeboaphelidium occidentale]|nr:hypothetical protein MP638_004318 [Amoeboaphelidium occidentale]